MIREFRSKSDIDEYDLLILFYLLLGSIGILFLFDSYSPQTRTITELNPSLPTYNELYALHANTLECPCSNMKQSYSTLVSISPTYHEICSSDFVRDEWIALTRLIDRNALDGLDARHFRLLSDLCQLVNKSVEDAIHRLNGRSFISSNVINEYEFSIQTNTTLNQFIQTLTTNFQLVISAGQLFTRVDQLLAIPSFDYDMPFTIRRNQTNDDVIHQPPPEVSRSQPLKKHKTRSCFPLNEKLGQVTFLHDFENTLYIDKIIRQ